MQQIADNNKQEGHQSYEALLKRLLLDVSMLQSDNQVAPTPSVHAEPTFTLSQIVEYCKKRVAWEDARPIMTMLNVMLRGYGCREDFELVDSIEEEFMNRKHGPTIGGDYVLTKNVENEVNGVASGATGINVNRKGE
jgi:hypothetical protein